MILSSTFLTNSSDGIPFFSHGFESYPASAKPVPPITAEPAAERKVSLLKIFLLLLTAIKTIHFTHLFIIKHKQLKNCLLINFL